VAILSMLMSFLASALQDTGAEAHATVIHFSQAEQKILLNHIQLISLGKIVFFECVTIFDLKTFDLKLENV
jgi:hypothetical protein